MIDFGALWLRSQIRTGETVMALRTNGYDWRAITDRLHLGSIDDTRRAAALFLSADLESRRTAGEGAGRAQREPAAAMDHPTRIAYRATRGKDSCACAVASRRRPA